MTDETVISAKSLDLTFQTDDGPVHALKDVNLDITKGDFISFIGPSGCGKTTTMRMIAGLEDVTEGEIFINGQRVNDLEPKDRDVAMVFQSYALYPNMTVYENIRFPLKIRGQLKLPQLYKTYHLAL